MERLGSRLFGAALWGFIFMGLEYLYVHGKEAGLRFQNPLSNYMAFFPVFFLFAPITALLLQKHRRIVFLHAALQLLPELFLFTLLLLLFSPWLRRRYSAQSCADLWALPGLLTYVFTYSWFIGFDPWLRLRLPRFVFWLLLGLWAVGFCVILGWKTLEHFRFRRAVLRGAIPASREEHALFRQIWSGLEPDKRRAVYGSRLKLIRSSAVSSPLTVGLFSRTMILVLPPREYSEEELALIFRHEGVHLLRQDNVFKFSTTFLCAAGWFIPSLWMVMKRASEDLELCCDELVTAGMRKPERRDYATLLLSSAGTEKGFTTCLSASARGLRYRLRRIMRRRRSKDAILLIGLLTALYLFFFGVIGLELDAGTVRSELLDREDGAWHVSAIEIRRDQVVCDAPEILADAENTLRELRLAKPLWEEYQKTESVRADAYVTLSNENGQTATLCIDGDELVFLPADDPAPSPRYRIVGGFDPDCLRSAEKASE